MVDEAVIEAKQVSRYFLAAKKGLLETIFRREIPIVRAVDQVDINVNRGEIVALVGESGCGKTTLGRMLTTLETPTAGEISFKGEPITEHNKARFRGKIQLVFQNPLESLDPRMALRDIVVEPLERMNLTHAEKTTMFESALSYVGLDAHNFAYRRPSDLSGGQRQRVAVARAIVSNPEFVVLDEPTSALDASVQSQVLNLLVKLHNNFGFAYLFITHNIAVARYISDRVAIMYAGKIVETGPTAQVMTHPKHPYTQALLSAVPTTETKDLIPPVGEVPSLINPPSGCRFHPRCPYVMDICKTTEPKLRSSEGEEVACWLYK
jgi:peptide/nickel transport system ATP-binding protein